MELVPLFPSTVWALIRNASAGTPNSVSEFVDRYRPAIVRFARSRGLAAPEAEDTAQEVFMRVFHGRVLDRADRERGRFRSLLLAVTRHVLGHHFARTGARKRGGGERTLSLSEIDESVVEASAVRDERDPEFDRAWLATLLAAALRRLERENPDYFRCLSAFAEGKSHREIAEACKKTEASVRNAISRGRAKLATALREEVAAYASSPDELEDEVRYLSTFLGHERDSASKPRMK